VSAWIACSERLPSQPGYVLTYWDYRTDLVEMRLIRYTRRYKWQAGRANIYCTHWQPLPEAPCNVKNNEAVR